MAYTSPSADEVAARRAQLAPFDDWNERALAALIAWRGVPSSYLDLGSGTGAMVNMARRIGVEAIGIDVINGPEHWFYAHDLNQPIDLGRRFQWVSCLEVAEHLPDAAAPVLADTIARHIMPGGLLFFSAAPPGQQGEHHVNCRPATYWRGLFYERGVSYRADYTKEVALLWSLTTGPASAWLGPNLQIFDTWDGQL